MKLSALIKLTAQRIGKFTKKFDWITKGKNETCWYVRSGEIEIAREKQNLLESESWNWFQRKGLIWKINLGS